MSLTVLKGQRKRPSIFRITLYTLSVIASGCGFVTQMLVAGYWSTAFSNDVLFFSVSTAFYFLSLGLGSLNSTRWKFARVEQLFGLTLFLCFWTGLSIIMLKYGIRTKGEIFLFPLAIVFVSGFVSGQIIPLTIRLSKNDVPINLGTLFFFDYTAAIAFTFLFTFVLLIPLGYQNTSLVLSYTCLAATIGLLIACRIRSKAAWGLTLFALVGPAAGTLLLKHAVQAPTFRGGLKGETAKVLINEQSHYQKIVFTEELGSNPFHPTTPEHILYLDGFIQFNSIYEQNYHFCLANIPAFVAEDSGAPVKRALVLGGGDGLVARNLLGIKSIEHVDQVELDPRMIELARTEPHLRKYNRDAFHDPRVKLIAADAFRWVREAPRGVYDLIVIDFPDPKNVTLSRLYSSEFYSYVLPLLSAKGVLSIQSGPVFELTDPEHLTLSRMPTTIIKTLASIRQDSYVYYNPRDHDAFVIATRDPQFDMERFAEKSGIAESPHHSNLCKYRKYWRVPAVETNTLNTLTLTEYLLDWYASAGGAYFERSGNYAVFLPE